MPFLFIRYNGYYPLYPSSPMAPRPIPRITKCSSDGATMPSRRRLSTDRPCLQMSMSHEARRKRSRLTRERCVTSDSKKSNCD
uniref:Uncharacterized protein n=1 Tax=Caenorhabditis japonica TaxID=281687 RepID=A0A8R1ITY0_CAEJA